MFIAEKQGLYSSLILSSTRFCLSGLRSFPCGQTKNSLSAKTSPLVSNRVIWFTPVGSDFVGIPIYSDMPFWTVISWLYSMIPSCTICIPRGKFPGNPAVFIRMRMLSGALSRERAHPLSWISGSGKVYSSSPLRTTASYSVSFCKGWQQDASPSGILRLGS